MLKNRQARHKPRRQRRLARLMRMDRSKLRLEKRPVDSRRKLGEQVGDVGDLLEPRPKQPGLSAVLTLSPLHREPPNRSFPTTELRLAAQLNLGSSGNRVGDFGGSERRKVRRTWVSRDLKGPSNLA